MLTLLAQAATQPAGWTAEDVRRLVVELVVLVTAITALVKAFQASTKAGEVAGRQDRQGQRVDNLMLLTPPPGGGSAPAAPPAGRTSRGSGWT